MNFSPNNEQGILALISALKGGADSGAAFSVFQNIQQQQAAQVAQRQQRLSSLAELLMGAATQGMPYSGAEALAGAAPGPMGPAVQNMLDTLYGGPLEQTRVPQLTASQNASGQMSADFTPAVQAGSVAPETISPAYMPPQPTIPEQMAMQESAQATIIQADLTALQADASKAKAQGMTLDQFVAAAGAANPELFASAPDQVKAILQNTFGEMAVKYAGGPAV